MTAVRFLALSATMCYIAHVTLGGNLHGGGGGGSWSGGGGGGGSWSGAGGLGSWSGGGGSGGHGHGGGGYGGGGHGGGGYGGGHGGGHGGGYGGGGGGHAWPPYQFGYDAVGHDGGSSHHQQGDSAGRVTGHYTLTTADGRKRKVSYVADEHGFRAKVDTNEPGTLSENPADVHFRSTAPKVVYPSGPSKGWSGGHGGGGSWSGGGGGGGSWSGGHSGGGGGSWSGGGGGSSWSGGGGGGSSWSGKW